VTIIVLSGAVSMVTAVLGTRLAITVLRKRKLGQPVRADGPQAHLSKSGTPTMGGVVIIAASLAGYAAGHVLTGDPVTASGALVLLLMTGLGLVGFADDFIKLFMRRSLGLRSGAKLAGQAAVGAVFAVLAARFPDSFDLTPASPHLSFLTDFGVSVGPVLFVAWVVVMVTGTSNAVNLTDGLDGLAAGCAAIVLLAYTAMTFITTGQDDLALVCSCLVGACVGFLWFNSFPAAIFMGDTGSLGLGGAIAALAVMTKTEVLLLITGGIFVIEALSVLIQVVAFQRFRRRVFLMAPVHHHFELMAWSETKIILRFWIIAAISAAIGFTLYQQSIT